MVINNLMDPNGTCFKKNDFHVQIFQLEDFQSFFLHPSHLGSRTFHGGFFLRLPLAEMMNVVSPTTE